MGNCICDSNEEYRQKIQEFDEKNSISIFDNLDIYHDCIYVTNLKNRAHFNRELINVINSFPSDKFHYFGTEYNPSTKAVNYIDGYSNKYVDKNNINQILCLFKATNKNIRHWIENKLQKRLSFNLPIDGLFNREDIQDLINRYNYNVKVSDVVIYAMYRPGLKTLQFTPK
jgi:hypothetical protein